MRTCRDCKETKPLMDFYQNSNGTIRTDCKECAKQAARAHRLVNLERYKEYDRARASRPDRVAARAAYQQTPTGREKSTQGKRNYIKRNPVKRRAHNLTESAIRRGLLIRQPCEVCGEAKAHAHHDDYSKPLEVRWLCTTHHAEWHRHNTPKCPEQEQAA